MSVAQLLTGSPEPAAEPRRRAVLTVVPVRAVAAETRGPFAVAVVALLVTGLFGLLFLNTVLGKNSFHLHELRVEAVQLADTEQALVREVESLRAPGTLARKATELGMVQAGPPAFLRLSDGAVLGATDPAAAVLPGQAAEDGADAPAVAEDAGTAAGSDAGTDAGTAAETSETPETSESAGSAAAEAETSGSGAAEAETSDSAAAQTSESDSADAP
jgi:hypothetical protein